MYLNIYLNNSLNMRKKAINKDFLINILVLCLFEKKIFQANSINKNEYVK